MVSVPPPRIVTDPAHGGRWTSLTAGGREWLWHREAPERAEAAPGDAFVDAGGLEECVPTVRGTPDHGDAWARRWHRDGDVDRVDCDRFGLARVIRVTGEAAEVHYTLTADPGFRFVWAAHALLDLSPDAVLRLAHGARTRLHPEAAPLLDRPYRSTGVEPMLGRVFGLADAGPGDAARVPASGEVRWRLTLTAHCRCP